MNDGRAKYLPTVQGTFRDRSSCFPTIHPNPHYQLTGTSFVLFPGRTYSPHTFQVLLFCITEARSGRSFLFWNYRV